jgi:hypothetical protein
VNALKRNELTVSRIKNFFPSISSGLDFIPFTSLKQSKHNHFSRAWWCYLEIVEAQVLCSYLKNIVHSVVLNNIRILGKIECNFKIGKSNPRSCIYDMDVASDYLKEYLLFNIKSRFTKFRSNLSILLFKLYHVLTILSIRHAGWTATGLIVLSY